MTTENTICQDIRDLCSAYKNLEGIGSQVALKEQLSELISKKIKEADSACFVDKKEDSVKTVNYEKELKDVVFRFENQDCLYHIFPFKFGDEKKLTKEASIVHPNINKDFVFSGKKNDIDKSLKFGDSDLFKEEVSLYPSTKQSDTDLVLTKGIGAYPLEEGDYLVHRPNYPYKWKVAYFKQGVFLYNGTQIEMDKESSWYHLPK